MGYVAFVIWSAILPVALDSDFSIAHIHAAHILLLTVSSFSFLRYVSIYLYGPMLYQKHPITEAQPSYNFLLEGIAGYFREQMGPAGKDTNVYLVYLILGLVAFLVIPGSLLYSRFLGFSIPYWIIGMTTVTLPSGIIIACFMEGHEIENKEGDQIFGLSLVVSHCTFFVLFFVFCGLVVDGMVAATWLPFLPFTVLTLSMFIIMGTLYLEERKEIGDRSAFSIILIVSFVFVLPYLAFFCLVSLKVLGVSLSWSVVLAPMYFFEVVCFFFFLIFTLGRKPTEFSK